MTSKLEPSLVELRPGWVRGEPGQRLMVVLRAPGCAFARRTGGCTNCGFLELSTRGDPVSPVELTAQLQRALEIDEGAGRQADEIDLFCSGSFLNDEEIPALGRRSLLELCGALPRLRAVVVESRPEYIDAERLLAARRALGADDRVFLEVGIGLETACDEIRLRRIRKGFTLHAFEAAAAAIAEAGLGLYAYLLLKPLGTGEEEALADVLRSGDYLVELSRRLKLPVRVALEPVFVAEGTPLHQELLAGRYRPPSLWTVLEATSGLHRLGLEVQVGLSEEGLPASQRPTSCWECSAPLRDALSRFNQTQDGACLQVASCRCRTP